MVILIDAPITDANLDQIQNMSATFTVVKMPEFRKPLPKDVLMDAEVIYSGSAIFEIADAPRLRWLQSNSAAINPLANQPVMKSKVTVANVCGAYSPAVAECAIGMLLALTRRITLGCRLQAERMWLNSLKPFEGIDLRGATVGIVGYGSIGRHIARIAEAMGASVLACKRNPSQRSDDAFHFAGTSDPEGRIPRSWFAPNQMVEMFGLCDVLIVTLPHVPSTERIIGQREIAALPKHVYVVNVGRGAVFDESALIQALRSGAIAGAALDVFVQEPLPPESPCSRMATWC